MPRTQLTGDEIADGSIKAVDLDPSLLTNTPPVDFIYEVTKVNNLVSEETWTNTSNLNLIKKITYTRFNNQVTEYTTLFYNAEGILFRSLVENIHRINGKVSSIEGDYSEL